MFNFSFIAKSTNSKTGAIPVTRTDKKSCPDSCPLKNNGCYASSGHSNIHWKKLDNSGLSLTELTQKIKKLPKNQLWRHNEAGDLPGYNDQIDATQLNEIVKANHNKKGYTYTHYPLSKENTAILKDANKKGFTINVSCNSISELEAINNIDLPKVVLLPENSPNKINTLAGNVIVCPAQLKDGITCEKCGLCQKQDRKFHIGFKAHGIMKKRVEKVIANQ